ncbi:arylesterase [Sphingomonas bacterium]|uniref:arylesterase n=1 Tax=Sphingomonas bacterium TaxID=1895847 RepID=UPI001576207A|nr:arylesterase [Sphingomonas bacterium]
MRYWSRLRRYGRLAAVVHAALLVRAAPAALPPSAPAALPTPTSTPTPGKLVWAFGDSLTEGYGLPPAQGFTVQLQAALRRAAIDASVRNGGVSGDTTRQGLARLRWGLRGLPRAPDLVIVEFGANDMLRGLPPEQAERNLDAILTELGRRHLRVLLTGMRASPNLGGDYRQRFDAMYPALARRHRVDFYPFFYDGVVARPGLIQADGLHPNARGVAIIVDRMLPAAKAALARPVKN